MVGDPFAVFNRYTEVSDAIIIRRKYKNTKTCHGLSCKLCTCIVQGNICLLVKEIASNP